MKEVLIITLISILFITSCKMKQTDINKTKTINVQKRVDEYVEYLKSQHVDTILIYGNYCINCINGFDENAIVIYRMKNESYSKAFDNYRGVSDSSTHYSDALFFYLDYKAEIDSLVKIKPEKMGSGHGQYTYFKTIVNNEVLVKDFFFTKTPAIYETKLWFLFKILDSEHFYLYRMSKYQR